MSSSSLIFHLIPSSKLFIFSQRPYNSFWSILQKFYKICVTNLYISEKSSKFAAEFVFTMANESLIQVFEDKKVRIVWNEEEEKYYFAVADIVQVLTDTVNPRDYIKKMLRRDPELKSRWGTVCPPTEMKAADGKRYKTQAADLEGIFRIIQSIPSKKAEPVKRWLAEVGAQRIDQMIDPETYNAQGVEVK